MAESRVPAISRKCLACLTRRCVRSCFSFDVPSSGRTCQHKRRGPKAYQPTSNTSNTTRRNELEVELTELPARCLHRSKWLDDCGAPILFSTSTSPEGFVRSALKSSYLLDFRVSI